MGIFGIGGVVFTIYHHFKNPQIKTEKTDALQAQAMSFIQESTDRRFSEMQNKITEAMTLASNHIHTVDTKVDALKTEVENLGKEVVRLCTTINERVPKK
jgi:prophage DNA circulation protein